MVRSAARKIVLTVLAFVAPVTAEAIDTLPYSTRTHPYSGWSVPTQGDIRTVGMSGATVGLADTFIAALDNPAGLAMTLKDPNFSFGTNVIYDGNIQNFDNARGAFNFGLAVGHYPWGFSIGYRAVTHEGQQYLLASQPTTPAFLSVTTKEIQLSAARIFFDNHLSIGMGFIIGQVLNEIDFSPANLTHSLNSQWSVSGILGVSYRLPYRLILGASYRLPLTFNVSQPASATASLPGFFQSIEVPDRLGIGIGWIPNRFVRADFSVFVIGSIENATLLRDNVTPIGRVVVAQPRLGLAYNFLDYEELKATLFLGTYYEDARIPSLQDRVHGTLGLELKPWVICVGLGIDYTNSYRNYLASIGVDLLRVMQKMDIVPPLSHPQTAGVFPRPFHYSQEGLPGTLVQAGRPKGEGIDALKVGLEIPNKIEQKAVGVVKVLEGKPNRSPDSQKKKNSRKSSSKKEKNSRNKQKKPKNTEN